MKARKLLATLLALAMTLSMLSVGALAAETENEKNGVMPISETGETAPVSNLPADAAASWAASSIERWTATGIVKGDGNGNFNPNAQLTRGELAKIFEAMFGLTVKAENTFGDLKGDEWYADAVLKCVAAGIMKGDGVNANAETNISRGETIVMFGRAVGVTPDEKPDLSKFTDGDSVADWAAGYLAPLTKMGILSGSGDGTINAVGNIDRASVMSLLDKSVAEYVNAPGEYKVDDANKFVVVNMSAKEGEVVISGTAAGVAVSAGTAEGKVVAKDLKVDTIKVDGAAAVSVEGKSSVGEVVANNTGAITVAKGVTVDTVTANAAGTITNNGTIKELTANAATKVDNKGTITKAEVKADGVVLGGKKPTEVKVDEGTKNPTNEKGEEVKPGGSTGGGGSSGGSGDSTTTVSGVVGVRPVDQANPTIELPRVTANATKTSGEDFVRVALSTSAKVPVHQSEGAGMGTWVGVAFKAPEGFEGNTFSYGFSATAISDAGSSTTVTVDDPAVGTGKYAVFFINATAVAPKTYINLKWGEGEVIKYVVDLSNVQTEVKTLTGVTTSTNELPAGVTSSENGLSFDGSTALVENNKSGALTQKQIAGMGSAAGGEYTVYYAVPQNGLEFDSIVRTVNGKDVAWPMPSETAADAGEGWWTKTEGDNAAYCFKWGATFATKNANGIYELVDNGVYNYTLRFVKDNNVVATYSFKVNLSGYTFTPATAIAASAASLEWKGVMTGVTRDENAEITTNATLTATDIAAMGDPAANGGEFVVYYTVPKGSLTFDTLIKVCNDGEANTWTVDSTAGESEWLGSDDDNYYFKWGHTFAAKVADGLYELNEDMVFNEKITFVEDEVVVATLTYTIDLSGVKIAAPAVKNLAAANNGITFTAAPANSETDISRIEIDSVVYSGTEVMDANFDFNISLDQFDAVADGAADYGMSLTRDSNVYTIAVADYGKFTAYMQESTDTDLFPTKIHFYVVLKDADGNVSGHMGSPELGEPTAAQCDLELTATEATTFELVKSNQTILDGARIFANTDRNEYYIYLVGANIPVGIDPSSNAFLRSDEENTRISGILDTGFTTVGFKIPAGIFDNEKTYTITQKNAAYQAYEGQSNVSSDVDGDGWGRISPDKAGSRLNGATYNYQIPVKEGANVTLTFTEQVDQGATVLTLHFINSLTFSGDVVYETPAE